MEKKIPLGVKIKCISAKIEQRMSVKMKEQDLTAAQAQVLRYLYEQEKQGQEVNIRALSEWLKQSHVTVLGLIDRLEQKGFVETRQDPADKRRRKIYGTQKAERARSEIEKNGRRQDDALLEGFTPQEKELFFNMLDRVWKNAGQM